MANKEEFMRLMEQLGYSPYAQDENDLKERVLPLNRGSITRAEKEYPLTEEDKERLLKLNALELLKSKAGEKDAE